MKMLITLIILLSGVQSLAGIASPIQFDADVRGYDKKWVMLTANKKNFRVHTKDWVALNGPVKTGPQKVRLDKRTFNLMTGDQLLNSEK